MESRLIVMLTHHDRTVSEAKSVFLSACDLPVECWGFKDIGLPEAEMQTLADAIRQAGKKVFLEVVSYEPHECMRGAEMALSLGCDYPMGTLFYEEVWQRLKDEDITYLPFLGKVSGSPSILEGTAEEMVQEAHRYMEIGIPGFDILAYRHVTDPAGIARTCCEAIDGKIVIAGSIASSERMQFVEDIGAWGFTMGSALFEDAFVESGGFRANLEAVVQEMATLTQDGVGASHGN